MTAHRGHRVHVGTDRLALDRLTPLDVSNLRIERRGLPMTVAALAILERRVLLDSSGELAIEAVRVRIEQRLHLAPRMRQRLYRPGFGFGAPVWVDDASFDLSRHRRPLMNHFRIVAAHKYLS
jgi:diacylglycerol O-acyltransferase / wax synthase